MAVVGSSARFHPDLAVKPIIDCAGSAKPIAAFLVPDAPAALAALSRAGVPNFRTPEACADAIAAALMRRKPRVLAAPTRPAGFRDADHHVVSAVIKWVEQGVAPERIIATRFSGGALTLSRPLCPYPAQAVYNGSGDVTVASNFACAPQIESASSIVPGDIVQIKNSLTQRALELPNR